MDGRGFAVLPATLPTELADALRRDAAAYEFVPPGPRGGGHFAMASLRRDGPPNAFADWCAHRREVPSAFRPNEASYQRYAAPRDRLGLHRDQRYYAEAIVIATLEGRATFAVRSGDDDLVEWVAEPGQVILLAGWRPPPAEDRRPLHRVDPPMTDGRLMIQLRMNLLAEADAPGISTLLPDEIDEGRRTAAHPESPRRA